MVDTGIMNGADVVAAVALGAKFGARGAAPTSTGSWQAGAREWTA